MDEKIDIQDAEILEEDVIEELEEKIEDVIDDDDNYFSEEPLVEKKVSYFEKKSKKLAGNVTMAAMILLAMQAVNSALAVFTAGEQSAQYLIVFIGYMIGAVMLLLPGLILTGMIRKGVVKFVRSCGAVIISQIILLTLLVSLAMTDGYTQNAATYAMLGIIYLADIYVTVCIVFRSTKHFTEKFVNSLTIIGLIASATLLLFLVFSVFRMIADAASSIDVVFFADTLFALISYFSFVMFIFAGMLTLHVKEFRK